MMLNLNNLFNVAESPKHRQLSVFVCACVIFVMASTFNLDHFLMT